MKTDYIKQYSILHIQKPHYGMTSIRFLEDIKKIIIKNNLSSILDYGCGKIIPIQGNNFHTSDIINKIFS